MPGVRLVLEVDSGEPEVKRIELEVNCQEFAIYSATNALMNEMHSRIKTAHNLALAGTLE
jgi:hypothetical protein